MTYKFSLLDEVKYSIYILNSVEKEILNVRDAKMQKRVLQSLRKLTKRIPNKPEMWKTIKGCKGINLYELRPKPYRIACYKYGKYILAVHIWRVQKTRSRRKIDEINKACSIAREVKDEFERFVREVQV